MFKNTLYPAGIYMFKVNNRNTRTRSEICSKLTIKTLWTYCTTCSSVSIVNFEQVNAGWVPVKYLLIVCRTATLAIALNLFQANVPLLHPPENIRKPLLSEYYGIFRNGLTSSKNTFAVKSGKYFLVVKIHTNSNVNSLMKLSCLYDLVLNTNPSLNRTVFIYIGNFSSSCWKR